MSEQNPQYPPAGPSQPYGSPPQYGPPPQPQYQQPAPYGSPAPPQQPQYGSAPQYPPPPPPFSGAPTPFETAPAQPPKKSRTALWIALGVIAVIVIAGAVAVVKLVLPAIQEGNAHLTTPQTVAGLSLASDAELVNAANEMKAEISRDVTNSTGTVGAFYQDPTDPTKIVMIAGVTGKVSDPGAQLDDAFNGLRTSGLTVSDIHEVNPGNLSGSARCGSGTTSGQALVVCAWADHGSVGIIVFFKRDAAASEDLFRQIRNTILTRG